jgi:hypothetical protein
MNFLDSIELSLRPAAKILASQTVWFCFLWQDNTILQHLHEESSYNYEAELPGKCVCLNVPTLPACVIQTVSSTIFEKVNRTTRDSSKSKPHLVVSVSFLLL